MTLTIFRRLTAVASVTFLAACSMAPLIGDRYGEPPPEVAYLGAKDAKGNEYLTWVNVSSFGPVPAHLQAAGDINCMKMGFVLRAIGYHPQAKDLKGRTTTSGGFYCQPQPLQALSDTRPPQVVMVDGVASWDRPGAFLPLPEAMQEAAEKECRLNNPQLKPLGYHPQPLDVQGKPMSKPGFLCAQ